MAITPEEAKNLQTDELEAIANAEANIDAHLKSHYQVGQAVRISALKLGSRAKRELFKRYRRAGWEVNTDVEKYALDQRDSPPSGRREYWVFKKAYRSDSSSLAHQIEMVEKSNNGPYS